MPSHTPGISRPDWPDSLDRTPHRDRSKWAGLHRDRCRTARKVLVEIDMLSPSVARESIQLNTHMRHRDDKPNLPRRDGENPADPAAIVRFTYCGEPCLIAADGSPSVRDNLYAIINCISSMRSVHGDEVPPEMFDEVVAEIDSVY